MAPTRTSIDEAVSPDGPGRTVEEERCSKADEQVDLRVELLPTAVPHCERSDFTADEFASAWWDKTVASTSTESPPASARMAAIPPNDGAIVAITRSRRARRDSWH